MLQPAQTHIDIPAASIGLYGTVQQEVEIGVQAFQRKNAPMAITLFQSAINKLPAGQPFYDELVYNLLASYKLLVGQMYEAGDLAALNHLLHAALKLDLSGASDNSDLRQRFAGAFQDLGILFFGRGHYDASVLCCRKAISIYRAPSSFVNLTNSLLYSGKRAKLTDFTEEITREQLGRHLFIACVPKSASTFLKNLLVELTGYRDVFMVYAPGQNEHDLYFPTLLKAAPLDTVTQQHCRASDANVHLMQAFGIRPIVLVRNIFDSIVSLLDFYNKGAFFNTFFRSDYQSFDEATKIDLLIDNVVPWYFQFVASWSQVEKQNSLDIQWLTYEELISDKPSTIEHILKFYGLGAPQRAVEQRIKEMESQTRKTRFNKGVAGRGATRLNASQKRRIGRLARYYPDTDFSRIGL